MCCIITCLGWMIDLIQRFWSFVMSCCISSAVCCLLVISSMAGIALGYNYSLAEYVDLKESNVSIFLKRGIFDDEISDLQLRRAKEQVYVRSGDQSGRRSGDEESSTLRSGRRLDDSVFESGDQNKYEGSLMKLTARPPYEHTTAVHITDDTDMQLAIGSHTKDSLDALKAVQSVIDARRAYAQTIQGPTLSPVPTIKEFALYNEDNMRRNMLPAQRRMMDDPNIPPSLSPARAAVPDRHFANALNWVAPLKNAGQVISFKNYGLEHESTTFPSSIVFNTIIRPTPTKKNFALFLTKFTPITLFSTRPTYETELTAFTQNPKELSFKEKLMAENDRPIRKHRPKSDEDYEYDIKGLPVRKRRSINLKELAISNDSYAIPYKHNKKITQTVNIKVLKEPNDNIIKLNKTLKLDLIAKNENFVTYKSDKIHNEIINVSFQHSDEQCKNESTTETHLEQDVNETMNKNLVTHIMTNLQCLKERFSEFFLYDKLSTAPNENDHDDTLIRETLFLNKIVSSVYYTNLNNTEDNFFKDRKTSGIHRNSSDVEDTSRPLHIVMTSYTAT